jgi:threonyl-tRNA synthetase
MKDSKFDYSNEITFPTIQKRVSGLEIAKSLSNSLAKEVLSVTVNGDVYDLTRPIKKDAAIRFNKWEDEEGMHAFWHSSAHLMAEALEALYPGIKLGIGPSIDNGFYYDVDPGEGRNLSERDLPAIENKMKELARQKNPYVRREVPKKEALEYYNNQG